MGPEMKDEQEVSVEVHSGSSPAGAVPEAADRIFLLECRLDQLHSALQSARSEADATRTRLAESAVREVDHARRAYVLHEEIAAAREEIAALHRRSELAEALRAEVEGRLLESGARDEAAELARLRREVREQRERAEATERTSGELRLRVEELTATRETLLTRVAEWQNLVREGDPEAVDLSEFIAALRGEILDLEHRNAEGERREAELRERLERAGVAAEAPRAPEAVVSQELDPEAVMDGAQPEPVSMNGMPSMDGLSAALAAAESPESKIELILRLGRSRKDSAFYAIRTHATASEPRVRAAAFEALGRLLENDPARLEPQLRWGLADPDPRVRRRVVLAAATASGLALRPLLEPLRMDPDPQVRRVIHEVLRRTSSRDEGTREPPSEEAAVAVAGSATS
jgi:hypothetical protein